GVVDRLLNPFEVRVQDGVDLVSFGRDSSTLNDDANVFLIHRAESTSLDRNILRREVNVDLRLADRRFRERTTGSRGRNTRGLRSPVQNRNDFIQNGTADHVDPRKTVQRPDSSVSPRARYRYVEEFSVRITVSPSSRLFGRSASRHSNTIERPSTWFSPPDGVMNESWKMPITSVVPKTSFSPKSSKISASIAAMSEGRGIAYFLRPRPPPRRPDFGAGSSTITPGSGVSSSSSVSSVSSSVDSSSESPPGGLNISSVFTSGTAGTFPPAP